VVIFLLLIIVSCCSCIVSYRHFHCLSEVRTNKLLSQWFQQSESSPPRPNVPLTCSERSSSHIRPVVPAIRVPVFTSIHLRSSTMRSGHWRHQLTPRGKKNMHSRWRPRASGLDAGVRKKSAWISRTWARRGCVW